MGTAIGVISATVGVGLTVVAGIGLLRLPDAYSRLNAVTKAATLGVVLTLIGVAALMPSWWGAAKTLVAVVLQLTTSALGGFAIARAAYRSRVPLSPETRYDQLAEDAGVPSPRPGGPGPGPEDFGPR
ncbi:monovalent cation/H(+) antiporter subunit G [Thermobifida halotolerans]|uniref:Monovalent cation/H(+) antiporter subunit G n=1 Tax=Thermobifida halotolerans TaxID=483545 RepID=A0A399G1Y8_9ACTN|nr:monovalent cation/H(+) antiporter subunit G [Thermobifida halotolerans]UOE19351.1 monovalent cation/H(+) antiporter subunit G [Thermobifida halotolerans]